MQAKTIPRALRTPRTPDPVSFTSPLPGLPAWCLDRGDRMLYPKAAVRRNTAAARQHSQLVVDRFAFYGWCLRRKRTFNFYLPWVVFKYSGFGPQIKSKGVPAMNPVRPKAKTAKGWQKGAFFGTAAALSHRSVAVTPLPPQPLGGLMAPRQP